MLLLRPEFCDVNRFEGPCGIAPEPRKATARPGCNWATNQDDLITPELVSNAGADADARNGYGVPTVPLVCTNWNGQLVKLLFNARCDANAGPQVGALTHEGLRRYEQASATPGGTQYRYANIGMSRCFQC